MQWDIGLDFGETGVRLATQKKGVVLCSPSYGELRGDELLAIGDAALQMLGRNPRGVQVEKPVTSGMLSQPRLAAQWMTQMIGPFIPAGRLARPSLVLTDTGYFKLSEKEMLAAAAMEAGAQAVGWIDHALVSAIGADMPVMHPKGRMAVCVGAGVLSASLISYGRIVHTERLPWGAGRIDHDIIHQVRSQAGFSIGERTAEEIKLSIASALPSRDMKMQVTGLDMKGGFPAEREITSAVVEPAVQPLVEALATLILCCAGHAPEELSADLYDEGVTLVGGGALLSGLDQVLQKKTGLPVCVCETPELATVRGLAKVMQDTSLSELVKR